MIATIDILLIAAYFIAIAVVGYVSSRRESASEYIIGDKKLSVGDNVATLVATKVTASVILTYVALIYIFGISAIWIFIGMGLGLLVFLVFAIKLKREGDLHNYYSIADYFYHRYGKFTGRLVSLVVYFSFFLNFTIQLIGGAKLFGALTGLPFSIGVVLCAGVILFYLYLGGFKAVVKTDIVQFIAIILLFSVLGVFLFQNFTYEATQWNLMAAGPGMIIPFLIAGLLFPFSAADLWQRSFAAKSVRSLKKSFLLSTLIYMLFGLLLSVIAIIIKTKLPGIEADTALMEGFKHLLPPGLLGVGLVALFAAIMSTADSYAFVCAGILMHDIVLHNKKRTVRALKFGILFTVGLGILFALLFESIVNATYLLGGFFMALTVVILTTWIKKDVNSTTLDFSVIIGVIGTAIGAVVIGTNQVLLMLGLAGGLLGLVIGAIVSRHKKITEELDIR